jgi:dihydroorotase-like cyclic amidohydrolase
MIENLFSIIYKGVTGKNRVRELADSGLDGKDLNLLPEFVDLPVPCREPGLKRKEDLWTVSCAWAKGA